MRIVDWGTAGSKFTAKYFASLDENVSQEILVALLSMDEKQRGNRWKATIVRKPKLGLIYIELRKNLDSGECQGLFVIGRCEAPTTRTHAPGYDYAKYRPGKAKLSFNGTAYFTPFELKEMSLAVAEAEAVWDYHTKIDTLKGKLIER